MQHIALLGASGSIGRQTLDVCRRHADKVKPVAIAVNTSLDFAIACAREFNLSYVVISDTSLASRVPSDAFPAGTEVIFGSEHLAELFCDGVRTGYTEVSGSIWVFAERLCVAVAARKAARAAVCARQTVADGGKTLVLLDRHYF